MWLGYLGEGLLYFIALPLIGFQMYEALGGLTDAFAQISQYLRGK